eukprot:UN31616
MTRRLTILGDGTLPLDIGESDKMPRELLDSDIICSIDGKLNTKAQIMFMTGHKKWNEHYDLESTRRHPFSDNGDWFKTVLIHCDSEITIDDSDTLTLHNADDSWKLSIKSPIVRTQSKESQTKNDNYVVTYCLCPVYGLEEAKWLIEWIQYNIILGISRIHVYLYATTDTMDKVFEVYRKKVLYLFTIGL